MPSSLAVCGKGRIATAGLSFAAHYAAANRLPIRVVASANADDKGYDTWQPSLIKAAAQLGVPCVDLASLEPERDLLLVSLEYDRIIRVARFASKRLFNVHFSALPAYRGVYTSIWPILNGESAVGVTLHYMDAGVDTGAIVAQRTMRLPEYTSARGLYELFLDEGLALFREWLPRLLTSEPRGAAQNESAASAFDRRSLDIRAVVIDLGRDAESVCRFVRGFTFPEYQLPTIGGRAVRSCTILPGETREAPGTALHATGFSTSFAVGRGGMVEVIWG